MTAARHPMLQLARYFLQAGYIQVMLPAAVLLAAMSTPIHPQDGHPTLALLTLTLFVIMGPLLLIGSNSCLQSMPIRPQVANLVKFAVLVLMALIGTLSMVVQAACATPHLILHGWPSAATCIGRVCQVPFWVFVAMLVMPLVRSRLRYLVIGALILFCSLTPVLVHALSLIDSLLLLPSERLHLGEVASGLLIGCLGLIAGSLWSVTVECSPWAQAILPWPTGGSGLAASKPRWRVLAPGELLFAFLAGLAGPRLRLICLTLVESLAFWLTLALVAIIFGLADLAASVPSTAATAESDVQRILSLALMVAGYAYIAVMAPRICSRCLVSRQAGVAIALASGPLLVVLALLTVVVWKPPERVAPTGFSQPTAYFDAAFPGTTPPCAFQTARSWAWRPTCISWRLIRWCSGRISSASSATAWRSGSTMSTYGSCLPIA